MFETVGTITTSVRKACVNSAISTLDFTSVSSPCDNSLTTSYVPNIPVQDLTPVAGKLTDFNTFILNQEWIHHPFHLIGLDLRKLPGGTKIDDFIATGATSLLKSLQDLINKNTRGVVDISFALENFLEKQQPTSNYCIQMINPISNKGTGIVNIPIVLSMGIDFRSQTTVSVNNQGWFGRIATDQMRIPISFSTSITLSGDLNNIKNTISAKGNGQLFGASVPVNLGMMSGNIDASRVEITLNLPASAHVGITLDTTLHVPVLVSPGVRVIVDSDLLNRNVPATLQFQAYGGVAGGLSAEIQSMFSSSNFLFNGIKNNLLTLMDGFMQHNLAQVKVPPMASAPQALPASEDDSRSAFSVTAAHKTASLSTPLPGKAIMASSINLNVQNGYTIPAAQLKFIVNTDESNSIPGTSFSCSLTSKSINTLTDLVNSINTDLSNCGSNAAQYIRAEVKKSASNTAGVYIIFIYIYICTHIIYINWKIRGSAI